MTLILNTQARDSPSSDSRSSLAERNEWGFCSLKFIKLGVEDEVGFAPCFEENKKLHIILLKYFFMLQCIACL